jgi:uncharacterized membrane protein YraQ (UPF0718 family)
MLADFLRKNKLLSLVATIYIVLLITLPGKAIEAVQNSMYYVMEMLMIMPVVFILTSIIEGWIPKKAIISGFGEGSGIKGNILAFLLGSFSAGPIYAAFPVCKMLLAKGAGIANVVIVLSTWAVVKVPMLANEAKFLGPKFMATRWALTTVSIFIMAYIVAKQVKRKDMPMVEETAETGKGVRIAAECCAGCGVCAKLSPMIFTMSDGKARVILETPNPKQKQKAQATAERCPAKAIQVD